MTHQEKILLKPGDEVIVRDDDGREGAWVVKYAPWQLGHGDWVIGLQGKSGGYDLERVVARVATLR